MVSLKDKNEKIRTHMRERSVYVYIDHIGSPVVHAHVHVCNMTTECIVHTVFISSTALKQLESGIESNHDQVVTFHFRNKMQTRFNLSSATSPSFAGITTVKRELVNYLYARLLCVCVYEIANRKRT